MNQVEYARTDLDPRQVLLGIDCFKLQDENGVLFLSNAGIHFYSTTYMSAREGVHTPFADITYPSPGAEERKGLIIGGGDVTAKNVLPLGISNANRLYKLGYQRRRTNAGYGGMLNAGFNAIQRARTGDLRRDFLAGILEMKSQPSTFDQPADMNPLLYRMRWFLSAQMRGAAITYARSVIQGVELLRIVDRGPGFFDGPKLRNNGYRKTSAYPRVNQEELAEAYSVRAWLLLESGRYQELIDEGRGKRAYTDMDSMIAYGAASRRNAKPKISALAPTYLQRAQAAFPESLRARAAGAWSRALQGDMSVARSLCESTSAEDVNDQYALYLLGQVAEATGDTHASLAYYLASARLSHGRAEGRLATEGAIAVARGIDDTTYLQTAQQLTQIAPDQPAAWSGLADAASRTFDRVSERHAVERVAAMRGPLLN